MPVQLNGATSGSVTLTVPAIAGTNTITVPAKTGNIITSADTGTVTQTMLGTNVAGNGPAFSAYQSSAQTLSSNTATKIQFQTKEWDTNNNFDATTNYRFTPTVAGYYQISGAFQNGTSFCGGNVAIYKNGSIFKIGTANNTTGQGGNAWAVSALVYLNGTDYVELYGLILTGQALYNVNSATYFQGVLVRSA